MAMSNSTTWEPPPSSLGPLVDVSSAGSNWTPANLVAALGPLGSTLPFVTLGAGPEEEVPEEEEVAPGELLWDYVFKATRLRTALDCGVFPALSLLGLAGNCLCVAVFLRQRYHSVAKPLLLALCASDVLFLLCTLLLSLPCLVRRADAESGRVLHVSLAPQVGVLGEVSSRVRAVLMLAVGVERSVAVTRPLKLRAVCTVPRTRSAVLAAFLCVLALQAPAFFRYDAKPGVSPAGGGGGGGDGSGSEGDSNVTRLQLQRTTFYLDNKHALDFYCDYFLLVILRGLPFVSTCVCFGIVLVSLKRRLQCALPRTPRFGAFARAKGAGQRREAESEHGDLVLEERKLTRALLAVILLRLGSELAGLVTESYHVIRPDIQSSAFLVARDVSHLLCVLTSAINFIVFMKFYKHFYVTFRKLVGVCH